MKENSSTKNGGGRSKGEIEGEEWKSYLAHAVQRPNHNFEHEGELEKEQEGEHSMGKRG